MKTWLLGGSMLGAIALTAFPALAASVVTLKPAAGHPNQPVVVTGTGFAANEAVDVYVDTVDTLLLVSSSTGTLTGSVTIPASEQPGTHYVTAIGRASGDATQAPFAVTTPWVQMGYGAAHLNFNPYENTINTSNVSSLGALWDISVNGFGATATVAGTRVFVSTGAGLMAVSSTTGAQLWRAFPTSTFYATPTVSAQTIYIGDGANAAMYAVNAVTGATIWKATAGGAFQSSAVLAGGIVYAGSVDDKVYAFNAANGKLVWTYTTGGFIDSSPAVVNGVVYIGSSDGSLYALNAATGVLIWSYKTGNAVESSPAVSHGVVYVGSDDQKLYAIYAAGPNTGSVLWSYTTGGAVYANPAIANNIVYVGATDGKMYAVSANSGALQWSYATAGVVESAVVANGVVYATSRSGILYAFAASYGGVLGTIAVGYNFLGSPTISDGVLYLNTFGYDTYAFGLLADTNSVHAHAGPPAKSSLHPDYSLVAHQ